MSALRIVTSVIIAAGLSACASGMSEDECLTANWRDLGERDGAYGEAPDKFNQRAARCTKFNVTADLEAYREGRIRGLENYCTPQSGFDTGRSGAPYKGVCPPDLEAAFVEEYEIGNRLYVLTDAYDRAVADYEAAVNGIKSHRYDLQRARDRYNENTLNDDDRASVREEMRDHRRQIEEYENDLPILEAQIDIARGQLDDYRAFLNRRGPYDFH